jgi:hypothetical protein
MIGPYKTPCPISRVGTFTQQLYDKAKKGGWSVVQHEK